MTNAAPDLVDPRVWRAIKDVGLLKLTDLRLIKELIAEKNRTDAKNVDKALLNWPALMRTKRVTQEKDPLNGRRVGKLFVNKVNKGPPFGSPPPSPEGSSYVPG